MAGISQNAHDLTTPTGCGCRPVLVSCKLAIRATAAPCMYLAKINGWNVEQVNSLFLHLQYQDGWRDNKSF